MLVLNKENKIFLGERAGKDGAWQFPQGGAEAELSLEENVLKELEEELGTPKKQFTILMRLEATHEYDFETPPAYALRKWRGQSQTFWLVKFNGADSDIDVETEGEFQGFCWCKISKVKELAESKRIPGYEAPLAEVETYLRSEKLSY